jgi:hypothetical protein
VLYLVLVLYFKKASAHIKTGHDLREEKISCNDGGWNQQHITGRK